MNIQLGTLKIILKIFQTEILLHPTVRKVYSTSQVAYQAGDCPNLCSNLSD